jgi:hypothetical protein
MTILQREEELIRANCLNPDTPDLRIDRIVQQSMPLSEPKFSELLNFQNKRYCVSYSVNNYYCSNNLNSVNDHLADVRQRGTKRRASGSDKSVHVCNRENPIIGGIGVQTMDKRTSLFNKRSKKQ